MKLKRLNKSKIITILLGMLLIVAVSYIAFDKWQAYKQVQDVRIYQQGYSQGVYNTVLSLYQQTENCQATTINLGNLTREVANVNCIEAPQ